jgi:hypothetical protein
MRRFIATYVTTGIAAALVLTYFLTGADLLDVARKLLEHSASNHLDAFIIAVLLIIIGLGIDAFVARQRANRESEIQAHRLIVLKSTMRTVQKIVNNALNEMQLFRLDGEGLMPEESLISFDALIMRTAAELKALADLESTPERGLTIGSGIDYERKSPAG